MNSDVGGQLKYIITADNGDFEQKLSESGKAFDKFAQKVDDESSRTGKALDNNIAGAAEAAGESFSRLESSASSSFKKIGSALGSIGMGTFTAATTAAVGALTGLTAKGMSVGSSLESNRLSFEALTGSVKDAEYVLSNVAQFAQENPFQMLDVSNTTKELVAMGRSAAQIPGDLQKIGAVSVATGADLGALGHVYGQISAQGKMMTQDMYQLVNQGVAIMPALSKVTKKSGDELRDFISKGGVTLDVFEKALGQVVDPKKYDELLAKMNNTIPRQLDRLKGSITTFATSLVGIDKFTGSKLSTGLAQTYTDILKKLADALRNPELIASVSRLGQAIAQVLNKFTPLIDKLAPTLTKLFDFVAQHTASLIPILGAVLVFVGKLGSQIPVVGGIINSVTGSFGKLKDGILGLIQTNPLLAAGLGLLAAGFVSAYKNSEAFRTAIGTLFQSIGTLAQKLLPAFQQIGQAFASFIASPAVIQLMVTLANVISGVADAIASLPTGLLTSFVTTLITLAAINKNKFLGIGGGIIYIISSVQQLAKLTDNFKTLPAVLENIGHNIMIGLLNGLVKGAQAVIQFAQDVANTIVSIFRSILGIHSPSRVMRQLGQYTTLGLAKGITDKESAVQTAMDNLANDTLNSYKSIMSDMDDFGMIPDSNTEYNYWKVILSNFTKGSEQYLEVLDQMKGVRKQINTQIVDLAKDYNQNLDSTINKIASSYGRFDVVNKMKPSDVIFPENIIRNTQRQVDNMEAWAKAQAEIRKSSLDPKLIKELGTYGVDSLNDLQAIAKMSDEQLNEFNNLWLKQQKIAETAGVAQVADAKEDTLKQIADLSKGLEGQVSTVSDQGGRLITSFGNNMVDALPTLDSAFNKWDSYLANATAELAKNSTGGKGSKGSKSKGVGAAGLNTGAIAKSLQPALDTKSLVTPDTLKDIEASTEQTAEQLVMGIAGVLGGFALVKFAPVLAKGLGKGLGKLFKNKTVTSAASSAANEGTSTIVDSFGSTMGQVAPQLTKGQQLMKTIEGGLKDLILLAGVIAAFAGAIWVVNKLIPEDFGAIIPKLGLVSGVVVAFGALSGVIGIAPIAAAIGTGLKLLAGVAVDVALLAAAVWALNKLVPDDFKTLIPKLALMGGVIAAFGTLAGVIGIAPIAAAIGTGLVLLAGVAVDITLLAGALAIVNAVLPNDFSNLIAKIHGIRDCINAMVEDTNIGTLIGTFLGTINTTMLVAVGAMYVAMASELKLIELIDLDPDTIRSKVQTIRECMAIVTANDDDSLFGLFKGTVKNFLNTVKISEAAATIGLYVLIAKELNTISSIELDYDAIEAKIQVLKSIVNLVCGTGTGSIGEFLSQAFGAFLANFKTDQAAQVINTYIDITSNLNKIQETEIDAEAIQSKLNVLKQVVQLVTDTGDDGVFKLLADAVKSSLVASSAENASRIFQAYSIIADAIANIKNKIPADITDVSGRIRNIETVISNLRDADLTLDNAEDKEYRVGMATNILNKFAEAGKATNVLPALTEGWRTNLTNIRDAISEVGKVEVVDNLDEVCYTIDEAVTSLGKFRDAANILNSIAALNEGVRANLLNIRDCIQEVGQIKLVDDIDGKITVAEKSVELLKRLTQFSQTANTITAIDQGKFDVISKICQVINDSITHLVSDLNGQIPNFIAFGTNMANGIKKGWDSANLNAYLNSKTTKLLTDMDVFANQTRSKGSAASNNYVQGFKSTDMPGQMRENGRQSGAGFANGLRSTVRNINSALGLISTTAISKMRNLLGIHSPSKVFYELGSYTGQGFANGLIGQLNTVQAAAEEITDAIRGPFEDLDDFTASISGSNNSGVGRVANNTTINQNNIINNGADYSTMMSDLKWALFTA